jgi:predicted amidohydrolase YtcJ
MLSAWTGHGKILNSAALRFFGYDEHTVIVGGELNKDDHGKLNGVVHEYAAFGIGAYFASKLDRDKIIDDLNLYYSQTVALGITSVQNMCSQNYPKQAIDIYSTHRFPCRVRLIAFPFSNEHGLKLREWNDSYDPLNDMNYVSGVKIILDGTPIERRACMTKPYNDKRGEYGYLNFNEEQLKQFMQYALERQQQILIHAVGDSSIHTVIHCMRSLHPDVFWKDKRLRIEHGEFAVESREDIQTLKQLGIVIVQNPVHFAVPAEMNARFDKEQAKWMQAIHTYVNNNIPLAIGGDGPFDPFLNIMFAVMHPDNPSEALTVEQAVIAYTYGSAYAEFKENEKGRLKGCWRTWLFYRKDIFSIPPDKLPGTTSVLTMIGGKIVYKE